MYPREFPANTLDPPRAGEVSEIGNATSVVFVSDNIDAGGFKRDVKGRVKISGGNVVVNPDVNITASDCDTNAIDIKATFEANGKSTPAAPTGGASSSNPGTVGGNPVNLLGNTTVSTLEDDLDDPEVGDIDLVVWVRCAPDGAWEEVSRQKIYVDP